MRPVCNWYIIFVQSYVQYLSTIFQRLPENLHYMLWIILLQTVLACQHLWPICLTIYVRKMESHFEIITTKVISFYMTELTPSYNPLASAPGVRVAHPICATHNMFCSVDPTTVKFANISAYCSLQYSQSYSSPKSENTQTGDPFQQSLKFSAQQVLICFN